ncbi:hypothetical protein D3C72_1502070 [compost metagenome]
MQRAEADFRFGHHGVARILDVTVEPLQHLAQFNHGGGRRQLAGADEVFSVRAGVDAMRVLADRDVQRDRAFRIGVGSLAAIDHGDLGTADGGELACLDQGLDAFDMQEHAGIALGRHHAVQVGGVFHVVLVAGGQLAVVRGGAQIHIAVNAHLPHHFHGLCADAAEQRTPLVRIVQVAAVVRQRDMEFGAAEHAGGVVNLLVDRIALVREQAVEAGHIRQFGDLVAFHGVHADARHA